MSFHQYYVIFIKIIIKIIIIAIIKTIIIKKELITKIIELNFVKRKFSCKMYYFIFCIEDRVELLYKGNRKFLIENKLLVA